MKTLDRRQFLKKSSLTVAVGATALYGLNSCASFTKVGSTPVIDPGALKVNNHQLKIDLAKEPELSQVGGSIKIQNENIPEGIIVARVDEHMIEIASLKCTHRGVEVEYDQQNKRFECASIGHSTFSLDGENLGGPAKHPLKNYQASVEDGILIINL